MTTQELAQRTRRLLEMDGWRSYKRDPGGHGICLFVAADRVAKAASATPQLVSRLFATLGFKSMTEGMIWNDEQESVEAIFERLEMVA